MPHLISAFRSGKWIHLTEAEESADKLESYLIDILQSAPPSDYLDSILETIENMGADDVSEKVVGALVGAVIHEIEQTPLYVQEFDAETELQDHAERLQKLATSASIDASSAIMRVNTRLKKLRGEDIETEEAFFPTGAVHERDNFDN